MLLKKELCGQHFSLHNRMRLFDAVVAPIVLYGSTSWTMTQSREERLRTTQRKMLRKIWGAQRRMKVEDMAAPEPEEEAAPATRGASRARPTYFD